MSVTSGELSWISAFERTALDAEYLYFLLADCDEGRFEDLDRRDFFEFPESIFQFGCTPSSPYSRKVFSSILEGVISRLGLEDDPLEEFPSCFLFGGNWRLSRLLLTMDPLEMPEGLIDDRFLFRLRMFGWG